MKNKTSILLVHFLVELHFSQFLTRSARLHSSLT